MVVAVLGLLAFAGLDATVNALHPRISEAQAVAAAVRKMAQVNRQVVDARTGEVGAYGFGSSN